MFLVILMLYSQIINWSCWTPIIPTGVQRLELENLTVFWEIFRRHNQISCFFVFLTSSPFYIPFKTNYCTKQHILKICAFTIESIFIEKHYYNLLILLYFNKNISKHVIVFIGRFIQFWLNQFKRVKTNFGQLYVKIDLDQLNDCNFTVMHGFSVVCMKLILKHKCLKIGILYGYFK